MSLPVTSVFRGSITRLFTRWYASPESHPSTPTLASIRAPPFWTDSACRLSLKVSELVLSTSSSFPFRGYLTLPPRSAGEDAGVPGNCIARTRPNDAMTRSVDVGSRRLSGGVPRRSRCAPVRTRDDVR